MLYLFLLEYKEFIIVLKHLILIQIIFEQVK